MVSKSNHTTDECMNVVLHKVICSAKSWIVYISTTFIQNLINQQVKVPDVDAGIPT